MTDSGIVVIGGERGTVPVEPLDSEEAEDPMAGPIKRAVRIVREGAPRCLSRAMRALSQAPLAPLTDDTIAQLRSLHPSATEGLAPLPRNKAVQLVSVDPDTLFRLLRLRVNNGSAPGPSGWTGSHLQVLADSDDEEARAGLCMLVRDLCNGVFGGATQLRLLASVLMPVSKKGGKGVRPIAMGEVFVKLAAHYSMSLIEGELPQLFPRIQFGVKRAGGSESAAQLTRAVLAQSRRLHPSTIALKTDFANAFNSASRARIWSCMLGHAQTEPLWRMFYWAYAQPSPLLVYDRSGLHYATAVQRGRAAGRPLRRIRLRPQRAAAVRAGHRWPAGLPRHQRAGRSHPHRSAGASVRRFRSHHRCSALPLPAAARGEVRSVRAGLARRRAGSSRGAGRMRHSPAAHSDSLESLGVLLGSDEAVHLIASRQSMRRRPPSAACSTRPCRLRLHSCC